MKPEVKGQKIVEFDPKKKKGKEVTLKVNKSRLGGKGGLKR